MARSIAIHPVFYAVARALALACAVAGFAPWTSLWAASPTTARFWDLTATSHEIQQQIDGYLAEAHLAIAGSASLIPVADPHVFPAVLTLATYDALATQPTVGSINALRRTNPFGIFMSPYSAKVMGTLTSPEGDRGSVQWSIIDDPDGAIHQAVVLDALHLDDPMALVVVQRYLDGQLAPQHSIFMPRSSFDKRVGNIDHSTVPLDTILDSSGRLQPSSWIERFLASFSRTPDAAEQQAAIGRYLANFEMRTNGVSRSVITIGQYVAELTDRVEVPEPAKVFTGLLYPSSWSSFWKRHQRSPQSRQPRFTGQPPRSFHGVLGTSSSQNFSGRPRIKKGGPNFP